MGLIYEEYISVNVGIEKGDVGYISLLDIITTALGITMIVLFLFLWTLDEDKWSLSGIASYTVPATLIYFVILVFV